MLIGMTDIMKILSRFLVAVFGFLILYANRFMFKRRKCEIGLYLVLGMKPRQLARMLALEILFINLNALVLGLILGTFGSQGLSLLVMRAFLIDLSQFRFVFLRSPWSQPLSLTLSSACWFWSLSPSSSLSAQAD